MPRAGAFPIVMESSGDYRLIFIALQSLLCHDKYNLFLKRMIFFLQENKDVGGDWALDPFINGSVSIAFGG